MILETMYEGQVNSPNTSLESDIGEADMTITVTDGSKLPAAPNIAVIGSDEEAETILYGVRAGNILEEVIRGVQGTAKAWNTGDTVARNFTEKDYAAVLANINGLNTGKIENAGAGLTKNGNTLSIDNTIAAGSTAKPAYNSQGLITAAGTLVVSDIPDLGWDKITSGKPTTIAGYGITDAVSEAGAGLTKSGNTLSIDNTIAAGSTVKPTYNAQGLITAAGTLTNDDIPNMDWSKITTGKPTTVAGYGITDAISEAGAGLTKSGNTLSITNTVTAGSSAKVAYNGQGLITFGGTLAAEDIPNLSWSKITSGKPTTLSGYGITNSYTKAEDDALLAKKGNVDYTTEYSQASFARFQDAPLGTVYVYGTFSDAPDQASRQAGKDEGVLTVYRYYTYTYLEYFNFNTARHYFALKGSTPIWWYWMPVGIRDTIDTTSMAITYSDANIVNYEYSSYARKDQWGYVYLHLSMTSGQTNYFTSGRNAFTLPAHLRPIQPMRFPATVIPSAGSPAYAGFVQVQDTGITHCTGWGNPANILFATAIYRTVVDQY